MTNMFLEWLIPKFGIKEYTPNLVIYTVLVSLSPFLLILFFALTQHELRAPPPAGCRKLGIKGRSNLEDQYSKKYAKGGEATKEKPWSVNTTSQWLTIVLAFSTV